MRSLQSTTGARTLPNTRGDQNTDQRRTSLWCFTTTAELWRRTRAAQTESGHREMWGGKAILAFNERSSAARLSPGPSPFVPIYNQDVHTVAARQLESSQAHHRR